MLMAGPSVLGKTFGTQVSKVYRLNQASAGSAADYLASLGARITKVATINASSTAKLYDLDTNELKACAIGDAILEDVGLLSESKLDLATTVDRQISIGNWCALTIYDRRTVLFIPGELGLVLTFSYLFPWLRLKDTTLRVLQFGLCPLECFFTILLQCFDELGVQECRQ